MKDIFFLFFVLLLIFMFHKCSIEDIICKNAVNTDCIQKI